MADTTCWRRATTGEVVMQDQLRALTVDEDEALRRLQWFEDQGCELSEDQQRLKDSIRARDRRREVRIPRQVAAPLEPVQTPARDSDA